MYFVVPQGSGKQRAQEAVASAFFKSRFLTGIVSKFLTISTKNRVDFLLLGNMTELIVLSLCNFHIFFAFC